MLAPPREPLVLELNAAVEDGEVEGVEDVNEERDVEDDGDITVVNLDVDVRDLEDVVLDEGKMVVEEDGGTIAVEEDDGVDIEKDDGDGDTNDGIVVDSTPTVTVLVPDSELDGWVRDPGIGIDDKADGKGVSNEPVMPVRLERCLVKRDINRMFEHLHKTGRPSSIQRAIISLEFSGSNGDVA